MSNSRPTSEERKQVVDYIESLEKTIKRLQAETQKFKEEFKQWEYAEQLHRANEEG